MRCSALVVALATSLFSLSARAAEATVSTEASAGQLALTIGVEGGKLRAASCEKAPCALASGSPIEVPTPFAAVLSRVGFTTFTLDNGRTVTVASIVSSDPPASWAAVVASPLTTASSRAPKVLFAGPAELVNGLDAKPMTDPPSIVLAAFDPNHRATLLVGDRRDGIALCGRTTLLSPKLVDPTDLELKPARMDRLTDAERSRAAHATAVRRNETRPPPLASLLNATGASSTVDAKSPAVLVDRDPTTWWAEAKSGPGTAEFVAFRAPREVPITELTFVVRPPSGEIENGVAPKRVWLATDDALVRVDFPEDAWRHPGTPYDVKLPAPIATSCLAIVLDDAYVSPATKSPMVTLAEVEARSAFDGVMDLPALAGALSGGGEKARAAAAVLMRAGKDAQQAIRDAYASLDDPGRVLALDVADQAPCEASAPLYVGALASTFDAEENHARTRIERCRRAASPALEAAIADPSHLARKQAADELALIAPDDAVRAILAALPAADPKLRAPFRQALARAASSPKSDPEIVKFLGAPGESRATLDLLRATGARLSSPSLSALASSALARVAPPGSAFDIRYLALDPASVLAAAGDAASLALLNAALADADPHLRAMGASVAGRVPLLRAKLLALAADPEPRVREAVARALRFRDDGPARATLIALVADEWTFVRSAAYDSLAIAAPDDAADRALAGRLETDPSPVSLARAVEAVSKRHVAAAGKSLRKLAEEPKRGLDVRSRAVRALGAVCDRASVDFLTDVLKDGASGTADADKQTLAGMAAVALGRLHPADLEKRLAPLRGEGASRAGAAIADSALRETDVCR